MEPCVLDPAQTAIELKYGSWRIEEAAQNVSAESPVFPTSTGAAADISTTERPRRHPRPGRLFQSGPSKWRKVVADRIDQESLVKQEHVALLDRVEQSTPLCFAVFFWGLQQRADRTVEHRGAFRSFSFDFDSPSNKVSRVAQTIATIQRLLRSTQRRSVQMTERLRPLHFYPNVNLEAEHFDAEWQWLALYGSWRSALFIFAYPENLLYPTLRAKTNRAECFRASFEKSQAAGYITPVDADAYARKYQDYFLDMNSLCSFEPLALPGSLRLLHLLLLCSKLSPLTRDICLSFALGLGAQERRLVIGNTRNIDSPTAFQSLWNRIPIGDQIKSIEGAVPYRGKKGSGVDLIPAAELGRGLAETETCWRSGDRESARACW